MNWYKKSQQGTFDFLKDVPEQKPPSMEESEEYRNLARRSELPLEIVISEVNGYDQLSKALNLHGFDWKRIDFTNADPIISVKEGNRVFIIDDFDNPETKDANRWIWDIYDYELDKYIPSQDFNAIFWDEIGKGSVAYHATTEENKDHILRDGLLMRDETRGISNRSTGNAVFASDNPDDISSYGNVIFKIDLGQMKADGYMPVVSKEEPLEDYAKRDQLAHKIGLEDFHQDGYGSEGIYDSTIIFYDNIPAKYLKII